MWSPCSFSIITSIASMLVDLNGKASTSHTHTEYAVSNHTHSQYANIGHTHNGYAASDHGHISSCIDYKNTTGLFTSPQLLNNGMALLDDKSYLIRAVIGTGDDTSQDHKGISQLYQHFVLAGTEKHYIISESIKLPSWSRTIIFHLWTENDILRFQTSGLAHVSIGVYLLTI